MARVPTRRAAQPMSRAPMNGNAADNAPRWAERGMTVKKACVAMCLLGMVLTPGRVTRVGDFTVLSTKSMDLNNQDGFVSRPGRRVVGEDKMHFVLFFPVTGAPA